MIRLLKIWLWVFLGLGVASAVIKNRELALQFVQWTCNLALCSFLLAFIIWFFKYAGEKK
jgi:hypothetical protein